MCVVLPIQITKRTDNTKNIDRTLVTVNIVFAHCLKGIDIERYPDEEHILPTNNTVAIYIDIQHKH